MKRRCRERRCEAKRCSGAWSGGGRRGGVTRGRGLIRPSVPYAVGGSTDAGSLATPGCRRASAPTCRAPRRQAPWSVPHPLGSGYEACRAEIAANIDRCACHVENPIHSEDKRDPLRRNVEHEEDCQRERYRATWERRRHQPL